MLLRLLAQTATAAGVTRVTVWLLVVAISASVCGTAAGRNLPCMLRATAAAAATPGAA